MKPGAPMAERGKRGTRWLERRDKPQYPSRPAPVRELRCRSCLYAFGIERSGRGALSKARADMRRHILKQHPSEVDCRG